MNRYKGLMTILSSGLYGMQNMILRNHKRNPLHSVDIKSEYILIQQKKSRLSASERRLVVYRYENNRRYER